MLAIIIITLVSNLLGRKRGVFIVGLGTSLHLLSLG